MGFDYGTSHRTIINELLETGISLKLGERCVGEAPGQQEERKREIKIHCVHI